MNPNSNETLLTMMVNSLQDKLNEQKRIAAKQSEIIK